MSWFRDAVNGLGDYIGFLPGTVVSIVLALALSSRVAGRLRVSRTLATLLMVSLGVVLAATVTPGREAVLYGAQGAAGCDLSRFGLAPWWEYRHVNETSLNVLLFIPLGALIGVLPRSPYRWLMVVGAVVLPFAIEGFQLIATPMGRACQSADVVDNLTGVLLGFAAGWVARRLWRRVRGDA